MYVPRSTLMILLRLPRSGPWVTEIARYGGGAGKSAGRGLGAIKTCVRRTDIVREYRALCFEACMTMTSGAGCVARGTRLDEPGLHRCFVYTPAIPSLSPSRQERYICTSPQCDFTLQDKTTSTLRTLLQHHTSQHRIHAAYCPKPISTHTPSQPHTTTHLNIQPRRKRAHPSLIVRKKQPIRPPTNLHNLSEPAGNAAKSNALVDLPRRPLHALHALEVEYDRQHPARRLHPIIISIPPAPLHHNSPCQKRLIHQPIARRNRRARLPRSYHTHSAKHHPHPHAHSPLNASSTSAASPSRY